MLLQGSIIDDFLLASYPIFVYNVHKMFLTVKFFKEFYRRDSEYGYSDDTIPENIYIFEVLT